MWNTKLCSLTLFWSQSMKFIAFIQPYCPLFDQLEGRGVWKRGVDLHYCSSILSWSHKSVKEKINQNYNEHKDLPFNWQKTWIRNSHFIFPFRWTSWPRLDPQSCDLCYLSKNSSIKFHKVTYSPCFKREDNCMIPMDKRNILLPHPGIHLV